MGKHVRVCGTLRRALGNLKVSRGVVADEDVDLAAVYDSTTDLNWNILARTGARCSV